MNDESLKGSTSVKRPRGTFFSAEIEEDVSSVKAALSSQTNIIAECEKVEYAEIKRLFNEKISERTTQPSFEKDLLSYIEKIRFLVDVSHVLKRIQPYCEVVDGALLAHMNSALTKIRLSYGCDLHNPETWKVAQHVTSKICEDATRLEIKKLKLGKLYGYVYDDMEWFVLSFKAADSENKRKFFSKLNEEPQLLAWAQPWIALAEGTDVNWRAALSNAIESLSQNELVTENRVYE